MYPELLEIGSVTLYTYGLLLAASYLLGLWLAITRARQRGLNANRVLDLGIYIIIAALVGAKLLLLIVDFVFVYWRNWHFWVFNVADSAISVGVAVMILDMLGLGSHVSKAA